MREDADSEARVRLDKWLWAARFFRTRSLAKDAIDGGKVHYNGARCKVSKDVEIGATLQIRQGFDEKIVVVKAVSGQRRGAPEAQLLYEETADSIEARAKLGEQRRIGNDMMQAPATKPNKRDRRQIHRFKDQNSGDTWQDD
jgi:ribosome-associated heat shock protein Hsp15